MPHKVAKERTGWRDMSLSLRHREWGYDCPAIDIDFLEYDKGRAIALCEWKHERAPLHTNDANMRARRDLANRAGVPLFVIYRCEKLSWFEIYPENSIAREMFSSSGVEPGPYRTQGGEIELVQFLYWLRGRVLPDSVIDKIKSTPFVPLRPLDQLIQAWNVASKAEKEAFLHSINTLSP